MASFIEISPTISQLRSTNALHLLLPRTSTVMLGPWAFYLSDQRPGTLCQLNFDTATWHSAPSSDSWRQFCLRQRRTLDLVTMSAYVTYSLTVQVEMSYDLLTYSNAHRDIMSCKTGVSGQLMDGQALDEWPERPPKHIMPSIVYCRWRQVNSAK